MDTAAKKQPDNTSIQMHMANDLTAHADLEHTFIVNYGAETLSSAENVTAPVFGNIRTVELWQGMFDSTNDHHHDWKIYQNDQYLMACAPTQSLIHSSIDQATESAYTQIFKVTEALGFPYLLRTWNYIPDITKLSASNNHYQQFCSGRARAYNNSRDNQIYPAATVVGIHKEELIIYFIAGKTAGLGVENPLQVSAYMYPQEYSKDPPLFSRAVIHRNNLQEIMFVSGTASIVGHSTQHECDVVKQLDVCLANIQQLLTTAANKNQFSSISLADMTQLKVYIKNPDDFATVRNHMKKVLGENFNACFIQADLCRDNLLVEIEALAIHAIN